MCVCVCVYIYIYIHPINLLCKYKKQNSSEAKFACKKTPTTVFLKFTSAKN